MEFRNLRADEIDCRVSTVKENGVTLLLYKDARCDMIILDETVGAERWQRSHELINGNLFCNVSIKFGDEWITKQDVGTESYTEKEKGQASDSFKRACFNWGLGRELYTAPFIWVSADKCNIKGSNGKYTTYDRFEVDGITIENKKIVGLSIKNTKTGDICFSWGKGVSKVTHSNKPVSDAEPVSNAEPVSYVCADCGKPFAGCKIKGKLYNAQQVHEMAQKMSPDGKARCKDCRNKATANKVTFDEL